MTQPTNCKTKLSSMGFNQLPFHWVRDNRHCAVGDVSGHAFSFLCQGTVLHRKKCRKQRLRCVVLHGMWREGLLKPKAGNASQTKAQVPAARFPKRAHLIRHLVLDYGILHATKRPRVAVASAQSSPQKHTCCQGHRALRHSSCPSSGWLHTPFPS